jgi:hypothetical protein
MPSRYYITLPDPAAARGSDPELSSSAHGAEAFARDVEDALRSATLFERWRNKQDEPEDVDPRLSEIDPAATVQGSQSDLVIDLVIETRLPGTILQQRLRWLLGNAWQLRDVVTA